MSSAKRILGGVVVLVALFQAVQATVLINEIKIYDETVELWNRGNAQNMTGWRMEMIHQNSYGTLDTFTYAFKPGYTIPADAMVLVTDDDEDDTGPLLYMGDHLSYFYEFSIAMYDAHGAVADYMDTRGFNPAPPDSTAWTGIGVYRNSVRNIRRNTVEDFDTYSGWTGSESPDGTPLSPNPGQTERRFTPDRYAGMVINEVIYRYSGYYSYYDYIELWNRGDSLDMTGWQLVLGNFRYDFPDGFMVRPGRVITVQYATSYTNDSTLSMGASVRNASSLSLLNADSVLVDYVYTGSGTVAEAGKWYGPPAFGGTTGRQRYGNADTDNRYDWVEIESITDKGKINPGQSPAVRLRMSAGSFFVTLDTAVLMQDTLYLSNIGVGTLAMGLSVAIYSGSRGDTVTDWSWLSVGTSSGSLGPDEVLAVPVTIDRAGEAAGTYYGDIRISHNMRDGDTVSVIPCTLTVAPVSLISAPDSVSFNGVINGGMETAYVSVINNGSVVCSVDSLVCDDPAFSASYAVPFTVAAYGTVSVPVVFEPVSTGTHTGSLTAYSSAGAFLTALTGISTDGPVLGISAAGISAAVDSGDTFATSVTLSNTGTGTLNVAGHYDSHPVVINEIRNGTWVEFRNRGPARSLAGWQLKWTQANSLDDPEYTRTFTFPDTVVIQAGGYFGVTDYSYYASNIFLYMNGPDFYGWITSYTLLDSSGNVVDYLERDIMRSMRPAGAQWYGDGLAFTSGYISRMRDRDSDSVEDWKCMDEYYATKGRLNPAQTAGYRTSWLSMVPAVDTVLAAGETMTVNVTLDARNTVAGRYADLLRLDNDGARPDELLPVTMSVGPQRYLMVMEDEITFPDAFPGGVSHDTLYLYNPGIEDVAVAEIDIYYATLYGSGLVVPATVAGGETLAVPLTFTPDSRERDWSDDDVYIRSDAVNDPDIRLWFYATSAKAVPVITSAPVTQAVEGVAYDYRVTATDAEPLDTVTFSLVAGPAGMGVDSVTGTFIWTPDDADNGWNTVTVRASDGMYYADQSFSVYVVPVNDAPSVVPVGMDTAYTQRDYARYINVNDADDAVLAYSLDTAPAGMTVSPAGLIEWTPDTLFRDSTVTVACRVADAEISVADTFRLHVRDLRLLSINVDTLVCAAEDLGSSYAYNNVYFYNGGQHYTTVSSVTFSNSDFYLLNDPPFTVSAGYGLTRYIRFRPTAMGTVTATVTVYSNAMDHPVLQFVVKGEGVNTAPRITSTAGTAATEDAPYSYQLAADDDEIDTSFVYALITAPAGMAVDSMGLVTWTPVDSQYGANDVMLSVSDGFLADTQSYVISVARIDDPPILLHEPVYDTAFYGVPYSYPVPVFDEEGDSLIFALTSPPTGMRVTDAGEIVWLPLISMVGTWQPVVYSVSDGDSAVSSSYMLYVANEQRLLSVTTDTLLFPYTPVGQASQCTLVLHNSGTASTAISTMPITNGVFTVSRSAPFSIAAGTDEIVVFTYTPTLAREETGMVSIVSDAVDHPDISILLRGISTRRAPRFTSTAVTSATEDVLYSYHAAAADDDPGDVLVFSLEVNPAGMTIDPSTGLITWTPGNDDAGNNDVTVRVTDGFFNVDQEYTLNVTPVNDAPAVTPGPAVDTTRELDTYTLLIAATDEEDDSLQYGFIDSLPGMTIDGTGMIRWDVPDGYGGFIYPVTYSVSDGEHTVRETFQLVVEQVSGMHPLPASGFTMEAVVGGNPAGSSVRFILQLQQAGDVRCEVFAVDGQGMFSAADTYDAGTVEISWRAGGAAGVYYYVVTAGNTVVGGTVMIVK